MDPFEMWEKHGLFIGELTKEDLEGYGRWTVGTFVPEHHPGYNTDIFVKSPWIARPSKYAKGKYQFKHRRKTGEWEYVRVLTGQLDLLIQNDDGSIRRFPLQDGEDVDIPPTLLHAWELPDGIPCTVGTSIFRRLSGLPIRPGAGHGYEFRLWNAGNLDQRLAGPLTLSSWRVQYVDVLLGGIRCVSDALSYALPDDGVVLGHGHHAFARPGVAKWRASHRGGQGVVLYIE